MAIESVSRRNVLKSLSMDAVAGSVLRVIPLEAAEYAHHMIEAEKAETKARHTRQSFFLPRNTRLCRRFARRSFRRMRMRRRGRSRRSGVH